MKLDERITRVSNIIANHNNIVFLGGAGVSTASGIPDFRSENGIYNAVQSYGHPPEILLSRTYFEKYTKTFFDFYRRELVHEDKRPNDAHYALAELEAMGKMKAVITQNIDGFHQQAGSKRVLEIHGSIHRNYCMDCGKTYALEYVMRTDQIPLCSSCNGIVRPDVVLYEEELDADLLDLCVHAIMEAEVLIVGGTSLNVYPAAGLIRYFAGHSLILINKGKTPYDDQVDVLIQEDIGSVLNEVLKSF